MCIPMDMIIIGPEEKIYRCSDRYKCKIDGDLLEGDNGSIDGCKDLFYSILKHDVKNKVRLIKGSLQILRYECDLTDRAEERLEQMERIIDNCLELIENISTYRELGEEEPKPIDMKEYLQDVLYAMEDLLDDNGFDVRTDLQEQRPVIGGPLIKNVCSNVIENAVKHSGGEIIKISCELKDNCLIVSIEDDGKGIGEGMEKKIFCKGFTTEKECGTGLGLYLVDKVMEVYGGRVEVKRSGSGGARFDLFFECA